MNTMKRAEGVVLVGLFSALHPRNTGGRARLVFRLSLTSTMHLLTGNQCGGSHRYPEPQFS